jgi:hypothetical protein
VLNLSCTQGHGFEGWFASEDDFRQQCAQQLVTCPLCGDPTVSKLPSAPRLNLSGARAPTDATGAQPSADQKPAKLPAAAPVGSAAPALPEALRVMHEVWLQTVQRVVANTEDVGERFPEEVRRMHYGEAEHRGVRGVASAEEREALAEEGIEVVALPLPPGHKGTVQ